MDIQLLVIMLHGVALRANVLFQMQIITETIFPTAPFLMVFACLTGIPVVIRARIPVVPLFHGIIMLQRSGELYTPMTPLENFLPTTIPKPRLFPRQVMNF